MLDWFHITMKITVLQQCARGLPRPKAPDIVSDATDEASLERRLESVKHFLWHGNSVRARDRLQDLEDVLEHWGCDDDGEKPAQGERDSAARMLKDVRALDTSIANNAAWVV